MCCSASRLAVRFRDETGRDKLAIPFPPGSKPSVPSPRPSNLLFNSVITFHRYICNILPIFVISSFRRLSLYLLLSFLFLTMTGISTRNPPAMSRSPPVRSGTWTETTKSCVIFTGSAGLDENFASTSRRTWAFACKYVYAHAPQKVVPCKRTKL